MVISDIFLENLIEKNLPTDITESNTNHLECLKTELKEEYSDLSTRLGCPWHQNQKRM